MNRLLSSISPQDEIHKVLISDSRNVKLTESEHHDFAFECSNVGKPQQLRSKTLIELLAVCKKHKLDFVVNTTGKSSIIIYFW